MTPPHKTAEERRKSDADRKRRFMARNPGYAAKQAAKRQACHVTLRERHREEYEDIVAGLRSNGERGDPLYRKALQELAKRHHDEWLDLLAAS